MTTEKSTKPVNRVIGLFPALLGDGGIQEASRLTAVALREIACRHQWASSFLTLNDPSGSADSSNQKSGVAFRGFGRAKAAFVMEGMREANDGAHIILAAHPNLALPAAFMQGISSDIHTIVMAHGIDVWKPLPALLSRALRRAKIVTAPSLYTLTKLVEVQAIPAEKVRQLPWPVSPDFLCLAAGPAALPLPPAFPTGRVVLTVGRWAANERYKGVDDLLRALAALRNSMPDVSLVAVGTGDDLPRLRQLAVDLDIADRAHFFEGLSRSELAACYRNADVFALASTGEGFGLVFLEAMAFAKPVIGVAAGGVTDLIEDGKNGFLVPPRDVTALARALERLLTDNSLCEAMGRCGASLVRERYRFETFRRSLEQILGDCGLPLTVG